MPPHSIVFRKRGFQPQPHPNRLTDGPTLGPDPHAEHLRPFCLVLVLHRWVPGVVPSIPDQEECRSERATLQQQAGIELASDVSPERCRGQDGLGVQFRVHGP
eukprot:15439256-Alexandrium_andersonii.AAC.1